MKIRKFCTSSAAILMAVVFGMSGQAASASSLTSKTTVGVTTVAATQGQVTALVAAEYRPYTSANFRYNLIQRTGYDPGSRCQTQHTMPQIYNEYFGPKGILIHDPSFGLWWVSTAGVANNHSDLSAAYNRDWKRWIDQNPNATKATVLQFNAAIKAVYAGFYRC